MKHLLKSINSNPKISEKICYKDTIPSKEAIFGEINSGVYPDLLKAFKICGVKNFYSHQAKAIDLIESKKNVVVSTSTSSGKSEICYYSILNNYMENEDCNALVIFPTKALANDQKEKFQRIVSQLYPEEKNFIDTYQANENITKFKGNLPRVLLSNFYKIHYKMLPEHHKWKEFFKSLKFIVVDEIHTYDGVYGSNIAMILRRIKRLCKHYGSSPQFIFFSATIQNPLELSETLSGEKFHLVEEDGSPFSKKEIIFVDNSELDKIQSSHGVCNIVKEAICSDVKSIVFENSRMGVEAIGNTFKKYLHREHSKMVETYRNGYSEFERSEIECKFKEGIIKSIFSTSALELGIDIGDLNCVVIDGFPKSISSLWQRAGRCGRNGQDSVVVIVAKRDARDKWYIDNPTTLIKNKKIAEDSIEKVIINPYNPKIYEAHILFALDELPLQNYDKQIFGSGFMEKLASLRMKEYISGGNCVETKKRIKRYYLQSAGGKIKITGKSRGVLGGRQVKIVNSTDGKTVGLTDAYRCFSEQFKGSIYSHRGRKYQITSNCVGSKITAIPTTEPYKTSLSKQTFPNILEEVTVYETDGMSIKFGLLKIVETAYGYRKEKYDQYSKGEEIKFPKNERPKHELITEGFYILFDKNLKKELGLTDNFLGALHAVEHVMISLLPTTHIKCSRNDIGGVSTGGPNNQYPAIFIYDGYEYGISICSSLVECLPEIFQKSLERITECKCVDDSGCPLCILSPKCGNENDILSKKGGIILLKHMLSKIDKNEKLDFDVSQLHDKIETGTKVIYQPEELQDTDKWSDADELEGDTKNVNLKLRLKHVFPYYQKKYTKAWGYDEKGNKINVQFWTDNKKQIIKYESKWITIKNARCSEHEGELYLNIGDDQEVEFHDFFPDDKSVKSQENKFNDTKESSFEDIEMSSEDDSEELEILIEICKKIIEESDDSAIINPSLLRSKKFEVIKGRKNINYKLADITMVFEELEIKSKGREKQKIREIKERIGMFRKEELI